MTLQGGAGAETVAQADPNLLEASVSQGHTFHYYPSNAGSVAGSWPAQAAESQIAPNGSYSNLSYHYNPHKEMHLTNVHDGANAAPISYVPPTSEITSQAYPTNSTYSASASSYSYGNTGHSGYYNGYQQQPTQSYPQTTVGYQNTGAPYQPISSFQNTGSYAGTPSYSSTYYNPGHYQSHQTYGGYTENGYSSQTNLWNQGNFSNYSEQNATYGQDSGSVYGSNSVAPVAANYQPQQYKQWADYYSQAEVTCAPGTENKTFTSTSTLTCPIPGVSTGYTPPVSLPPPPPYIPAWKPDTVSSTSAVQIGAAVVNHNSYWQQASQSYPNQANYQKPPSANSSFIGVQEPQQSAEPMGHLPPYNGANQVTAITHQPLQPLQFTDIRKVSKLQIPTNPRIASNLSLGLTKSDKDSSTTSASVKPAYVSVSLSNPSEKTLSTHGSESSDTVLKPGVFPASLRGYVERALARCKGEKQMAASQEIMKEMITKATADGTLHSRDWDMEPLFPLPDAANVECFGEMPVSSLPKLKRSPNRRTKSRWEPMPEEKPVDNATSTSSNSVKYAGWTHFNGRDKKFAGAKSESKESNNSKFSFFQSATHSKNAQRPFKRQRFSNHNPESGDASSDSDPEKGLAATYSGAMALASSPEERKKRENRSKRFEKVNGQKREIINNNRVKTAGTGNVYSKRATALVLNKAFEDNSSRAVEDIDWDALTVKGTCQEIEKRYLRLTSAPDPATVRPEEVLEKALLMVLNSQKSYLYKCDQLKSIRQDLTVQRIRNELTAKVYETHARLALEYGDLPEYNQCQSQLKFLYGEGIAGCHMEFSAYSLLSVILHSNNKRELLSSMARLSAEAKRDEGVKHALAVRQAVNAGNYVLFFRLYKSAPNLNTFLMDLYVEKMRFQAVQCMSRAYRPTVPVSYIARALGFSSLPAVDAGEEKEADGLEDCIEWLKAHGACLISENNGDMQLDAKASSSSLYMPEPEDAVAHGDANLAVNDFFTRAST